MEKLNIPIELLKRYKGSKADKELLAFSIGIKSAYTNSVFFPSIRKVMLMFGIGFAKAKNLIERSKTSELFRYDKSNDIIIANTYKSKDIKKSRNGWEYSSDFCYKTDKSKKTLADIVDELNRALLLNAINGEQRNNLTQRLGKPEKKQCCVQHSKLTSQKFANISGLPRSTAHRLLTKMYDDERILDRTSKHMVMVIPVVNEETVAEWRKRTHKKKFVFNPNDRSGWVVIPTSYTIHERSVTERFQHVIYTHKKRIGSYNCNVKSAYDNQFDNPVMGIYD